MTTVAATSHPAPAHHDDRSFIRKYVFSTDHKIIGIQFLFVSLFFLLVGGLLAMQMRWQLGFPGKPMPGGGVLPESMAPGGVILPEYYIQLLTMHGTFMVFFAIMPLLVGVYANFLIPLKIGTHDMAFPRINMWSFWSFLAAGLVMLSSLFVPDGAARAGWTMYAPLSARHDFSGASIGQELWSVSIILVGLSSILGSLNYITTIINNRAPGMTWFRLPLSVWSLFITAILGLLALPVLSGAAIMLLFDQIIGTHFFDPAAGGQALLWQHLFWFFGHPEVYILILPAMGMVSDIIANGSRKPIFGYHSMVFAIVAIAFLGWIVWGHHMFVSGMNPTLGSSFMVSTLVIAVPSAVKTFNWMGTMWRGNIKFTVPMLNAVAFVAMFVIGGLSGIFMAATPVDMQIHDTYFIVAHLHYVLFGGSLFALFAAIPYWYPKMFGRDERAVGQGAFLVHVHLLQLHLFPDAHHGDGWGDATALRPEPVHLLAALPAYPGVHLDQRVPAVRDADHLLREFLVEPQEGETGGPESVAGQRARVDAAESRAARQLGTGADGVPRAVRVQLAAGAGGLPAADPQAPGRPGAGRRLGRPLTTGEDDR